MAKETVDALVDGGKATAGPPLGPALGPLGINIGQVISEINKKTADFKGMRVPVKVIVDKDDKSFEITVGTPPASALIKKEAGIEKAASNPLTEKVADLKIEQIIKISKMKESSLLGKDNFGRVKEIIGTCQSMGILVEGKPAHEMIDAINAGQFKDKIISGKTELTDAEKKALEAEKLKLQEDIKKKRAQFETKAKGILKQLEGKDNKEIRKAMIEAEIPMQIIDELAPAASKEAAPGAEKKK